MAAIEILGLEKTYAVGFWRNRPKQALKPLILSIEEGETFGFLGPNGAGKTTTLKLLMGLIRPTSGQARILGMQIDDLRVKAQIGFLPEQPYFYDYLTARELLSYYAQLSDVPAKTRSADVSGMLERVARTATPAAITAILPTQSVRERRHKAAKPVSRRLCLSTMAPTARSAVSATAPMITMGTGCGMLPRKNRRTEITQTKAPKSAMTNP